jgi:hypothetical protein
MRRGLRLSGLAQILASVTVYSSRRWQIFALALPAAAFWAFAIGGKGGVWFAALLLGVGLVVLRRPRLSADERGLTIVNLVRTRHVPWTDVARLGTSDSELGLAVQLGDGRILHAWVLTANPRSSYPLARREQILAEVGQLQARATGRQAVDDTQAPFRDRREGWSIRFQTGLWLVLCLFFLGFGTYTAWHSAVALPRTYAQLRSSGVPATARLASCGNYGGNGVSCRLQLSYAGKTRIWTYPNDVHQFHGLPLGAPIAMLVDPTDPEIAYTVGDVNANTNAGWGILSFLGLGLAFAGAAGLLWEAKLRGLRSRLAGPAF